MASAFHAPRRCANATSWSISIAWQSIKGQSIKVDGAAFCKCHQGAPHHPTLEHLGHAQDMAEVTETALANRTKRVILWGCCCQSVVLASDYVQAAAVETVLHTAHHWLSERPGFRCVCQRRTHRKLVRPQLQRVRQPVVCPYAGERAERSLCDGHAMTNVSVVTLHSRPQILERVDVLERSVADVHLALQSLSSTPLCSLHSSIGQRAST